MVTVQVVVVPLHAPPQDATRHPVAGAAVSATLVPVGNSALPLVCDIPIAIPEGLDTTVPCPLFVTLSRGDDCGTCSNAKETERS
jgi:hypothetical protein